MASSIAFPTEPVSSRLRTMLARTWRWLAVTGAAIILAAAALVATRSGWFHVRHVAVNGAGHLTRGEVVRLSGITRSDNALWLDEGVAEARLAESPWVSSADVRVDLPWTVTVTVTERSPIAIVERGPTRVLVAADGTLLGPARTEGLPVIEAPPTWVAAAEAPPVEGIARALAALDPDLQEMVRRVDAGSQGGLVLSLSDGVRIAYGEPRAFEEKARAIDEVLAWVASTGERIRALDVSAPSAPAVTPVA